MNILRTILLIFLYFCSSAYAADTKSIAYCQEKINQIAIDKSLKTIENKLKEWQKYKKECSIDNFHTNHTLDIYTYHDDYVGAKKYIFNNLDSNKNTKYLEHTLGLIYFDLRDGDSLYHLAHKLMLKYPRWYSGYYHAGVFEMFSSNFDKAEEYFFEALTRDSKKSHIYSKLCLLYYYKGDVCNSLKYYEKAFKLDPHMTMFHHLSSSAAAICFAKTGDFKDAKKILNFLKKYVNNVESSLTYQEALAVYSEELNWKKYDPTYKPVQCFAYEEFD